MFALPCMAKAALDLTGKRARHAAPAPTGDEDELDRSVLAHADLRVPEITQPPAHMPARPVALALSASGSSPLARGGRARPAHRVGSRVQWFRSRVDPLPTHPSAGLVRAAFVATQTPSSGPAWPQSAPTPLCAGR